MASASRRSRGAARSTELALDGTFVPFDAAQGEGWSWIDADNGELALHGEASTRAQALPLDALKVIVSCAP
jgi:hypothetical protein